MLPTANPPKPSHTNPYERKNYEIGLPSRRQESQILKSREIRFEGKA